MTTPATPSPEDLDAAADWVRACRGEDRRAMEQVAQWLTYQADRGRRSAAKLAERRSMKALAKSSNDPAQPMEVPKGAASGGGRHGKSLLDEMDGYRL